MINAISAKSLEMTETVESMDINICNQSMRDVEKMSEIVSEIETNFDNLQEANLLTILQQNRDNILIKDMDMNQASLTLQGEQLGASCDGPTTKQVKIMCVVEMHTSPKNLARLVS